MIGPRHLHKGKAKNALSIDTDDKKDNKVNGKKSKTKDSDSEDGSKRKARSPSGNVKRSRSDKIIVDDIKPIKGYVWTGSSDTESGGGCSSDSDSSRRKSISKTMKDEEKKTNKPKKEKEFAWMDSESGSGSGDGSDSEKVPKVPLDKVETLSQMARIAPKLRKQLKDGELRPQELGLVCIAAAKTKFFDGGLFESMYPVLRKAFKKEKLRAEEVIEIVCALASLNAYNTRVFDSACATLKDSVVSWDAQVKERLKAALAAVGHNPGSSFMNDLQAKKAVGVDNRGICHMFVRGQCKWGGRCKQSHDLAKFDEASKGGQWKGLEGANNKSRGFQQSADLFKMDKRGALW